MRITKGYVEKILLREEMERRVAEATIQVGDVRIGGITVWRSANGHVRVYWPKHWSGPGRSETIDLPPELRAEIETEVITAYKEAKVEAKKAEAPSNLPFG